VPPSPARPGLIDRHDLVAALDHAAEKKMTIISAPAGSGKTSLLRAWAGRLGQGRRIAFMSVRPGQHDAHRTRQSPEFGDGLSPSQR
jgi:LuxR family maltose regulon positive regulatory protein